MKENKENSRIFTKEDLKSLRLEVSGLELDSQTSSQPQTSNFKPQTPFLVPKGYFDSLPEQVMHQIESLPDFESIAKVNPYAVPKGYFDSLPTTIQQRIINGKSKRIPTRLTETVGQVGEWIAQNVFIPKYALALASVTLVVLFGVNYMKRTISVESSPIELSASEIGSSNYLYEMDESLFIDALADQTSEASTTDKSAEDYLIDNNIDLTSITEQL